MKGNGLMINKVGLAKRSSLMGLHMRASTSKESSMEKASSVGLINRFMKDNFKTVISRGKESMFGRINPHMKVTGLIIR